MSLIREKFNKTKPLICYFMAGYPDIEDSYLTAKTLIENGADILEVGVPFSDPVADGPTIQVAHEKAVKDGITPLDVLELVENLKKDFPDIPLVLMTYYNPIFIFGTQKFCELSKEKGVDGFIIPDLPPEEAKEFKEIANRYNLSTIFLLAPTSNEERIKLVSRFSDDFIYYVSLTGITGAREQLPWDEVKSQIYKIKSITDKPIAVGFGVSKKEHTKILSKFSDGVIVGSAIVKLQGKKQFDEIGKLVKSLKEGLG